MFRGRSKTPPASIADHGTQRIGRPEIAAAAARLPALPPSAARLSAALARANWRMDEIVSIVSLDPVLAGRVLALANSATYARGANVVSIGQAAMLLGAGAITSMAVAVAAHGILSGSLSVYRAPAGALWRHSVAAAVAVESIGRVCGWTVPSESNTAALLHDVGKLLLSSVFSSAAARLVGESDAIESVADERVRLGIDHAEAGAMLAEAWMLPRRTALGIRRHHELTTGLDADDLAACRAVTLANRVANRLAPVFEAGGVAEASDLGVAEPQLLELIERTGERWLEIERLYS